MLKKDGHFCSMHASAEFHCFNKCETIAIPLGARGNMYRCSNLDGVVPSGDSNKVHSAHFCLLGGLNHDKRPLICDLCQQTKPFAISLWFGYPSIISSFFYIYIYVYTYNRYTYIHMYMYIYLYLYTNLTTSSPQVLACWTAWASKMPVSIDVCSERK